MLYILHGDATDLRSFEPGRPKLLAHVCNDQGLWGAGFSGALSARWKEPEIQYRHYTPRMGDVQFVAVEEGLWWPIWSRSMACGGAVATIPSASK